MERALAARLTGGVGSSPERPAPPCRRLPEAGQGYRWHHPGGSFYESLEAVGG